MFLTPTEGLNLEGMTFTQHNLTLLEVVNKTKNVKLPHPTPFLFSIYFKIEVGGYFT